MRVAADAAPVDAIATMWTGAAEAPAAEPNESASIVGCGAAVPFDAPGPAEDGEAFRPGPAVVEPLAPDAVVLRRFAAAFAVPLWTDVQRVVAQAPFRHMQTARGAMAVAMTNCGALGWVSDRTGYRYDPLDPVSGRPWSPMPASFRSLAVRAAAAAGFKGFEPDACLVNRYEPGARLSLHRDADERDFTQPIVSVSLGLPATFLFGGARRTDPTLRVPLEHGDVVVWGGPARMRYHGVLALKDGLDPLLGRQRINLTFRKAG